MGPNAKWTIQREMANPGHESAKAAYGKKGGLAVVTGFHSQEKPTQECHEERCAQDRIKAGDWKHMHELQHPRSTIQVVTDQTVGQF